MLRNAEFKQPETPRTHWPLATASRFTDCWPLFCHNTSLPPHVAGRKLASFACPISPRFAISCDLPMINVRANWLCFGTFRSSPALCLRLHGLPATILNAPRFTLHATRAVILRDQRGRVVRRPSPAGYCLVPTVELPKNDRDPISTSGPSSFSMSPDGQIHRTNPSFFLARRRTVYHSPVAGGAQCQWLQACLPDGHTAQCLFSACFP